MTRSCPRCRKTYEQDVQFCPDDGAPVGVCSDLDPAVPAAFAPDYRILDWLGSGGIGNVYLAEQIRVGNRKVALKLLHRKFSEDAEFIGRFQNEAASTRRINHPNVITIYESQQAPDGTLYIAMELVEGESLSESLRRRGPLPLDEVVEIVAQCCKALGAAHRLGIAPGPASRAAGRGRGRGDEGVGERPRAPLPDGGRVGGGAARGGEGPGSGAVAAPGPGHAASTALAIAARNH